MQENSETGRHAVLHSSSVCKLPSKERRTHFGFLGDGIVSSTFFPFALADPRQPDEGQERQHREEDRLRGIDPEPCVRTGFPDQAPLSIIGPHQGEEDQEANAVNHGAGENRLREVGHRTEHHV
jgi:hypothetical protein